MASAATRREQLKAVWQQAQTCTRCPQLASTRTRVVFGAGNADAELMFVGEAPGANEDRQGLPFVGQAGKLLDTLLGEIGLARSDVFIANTLKCLRGSALVQLGDGSWEQIERLARSEYAGAVMSLDPAGRPVRRRVTGWHVTPLGGRRMLRLTRITAAAGVELTDDHPVLTSRGFVPAGELRPADQVVSGEGLPGDVGVVDVTGELGADSLCYCLDVEETHNFVTPGGVVHNCRPPGNRDPLPTEIDACREYLLRQLELIEPRVVCTLGNFATKLLRADPATGITRLHGREEIRRIGARNVRLYPLYHPAAALYTPAMLEILRSDFARIPELLALPALEQPLPDPTEPAEQDSRPAARVVPDPVAQEQPSAASVVRDSAEQEQTQLGLF